MSPVVPSDACCRHQTEAEVPGRPVYLLSEVTWGAFRDVQDRVRQYWYWGRLRERAAYLFGLFKGEAAAGEGGAICSPDTACWLEMSPEDDGSYEIGVFAPIGLSPSSTDDVPFFSTQVFAKFR